MSKITIDRRIRGLSPDVKMRKEALERAFQVALTTLGHLDTIVHLIEVEIVKVSWKTKEKWEKGKSPLLTDFQIVFRPFSGEKLRVRVIVRFDSGGTVLVYEDDPEKDGSYITTWVSHPVKELEVEHIVNLLLKAMGMVVRRHQSLHVEAGRRFGRVGNAIEDELSAEV